MASPFHVFRKHQRPMMVVVGILCMVGFSLLGVLDYTSNRSQGGEDPVVATAFGKNIKSSEVQQMIRRRAVAINFMAQCKAAEMNFPDFAQLFANQFERFVFGPASEEEVVKTWMLDERARQMGLVVDDQAINAFIRDQTGNKVKADVFREIAQRLGVGPPQIFDALRGELLALRLREMALSGLQTTPAQRWDYYRRQKQRATVEVVPVRVEDFVDEVADAPDEELRAFFADHKDQEPNPQSPVPGFKVPKKASFQVVIAKFSDFEDPTSATDEEVKQHYEKFKDTRYLWDQFSFEDDRDEEPSANNEEKPSESSDEKAKEEKKADETKTDKKGDAKADDKSQSSLLRVNDAVISLMAHPSTVVAGLLMADDADPKSDEKAVDRAVPADPAEGEAEKPADSTDQAKSDEAPPIEKKAGQEKSSKKTKVPAVAPPITSEYMLLRDIRQGPHPKHAPLWKVEDAIRKELARDKANKKIEEALQVVREKMRKYARRMGPDDTELKMPDLEKVAKSQGLSVVETGQLTELELAEKFPDLAEAHGEQPNMPFRYIAYSAMAKFQSTTVQDVEANRYLVWKTDEQEAYSPEFADVRSKVLRVWKMTKARDLATKKARELAEKANKEQKPLKELFAGREGLTVTQTPPFSWLTRGTANVDNRAPLRISEVEGIDSPGPEFMREVFNLGVGAAGEGMNAPQTIAYVVRVLSLDPTREVLRAGFMSDPFPLYKEVASEDMAETQQAWIKGIEAEARLTWKNPEAKHR